MTLALGQAQQYSFACPTVHLGPAWRDIGMGRGYTKGSPGLGFKAVWAEAFTTYLGSTESAQVSLLQWTVSSVQDMYTDLGKSML